MAKREEDAKFGTAQAKVSEDDTIRVAYKHGTPLEAGKIADSKPVDLFSSAHNIPKVNARSHSPSAAADNAQDAGPRMNDSSN